jgi:hypothetical protein
MPKIDTSYLLYNICDNYVLFFPKMVVYQGYFYHRQQYFLKHNLKNNIYIPSIPRFGEVWGHEIGHNHSIGRSSENKESDERRQEKKSGDGRTKNKGFYWNFINYDYSSRLSRKKKRSKLVKECEKLKLEVNVKKCHVPPWAHIHPFFWI